jgi:plasmid stabilization system protein ParE
MAELPLEFHPDARADALEAYDWYAERNLDAAIEFQIELENAGRTIQEHPNRWATYLFNTRRYLLKRYPFVIVYRVTDDRIEILAVAHGRRKPGYWKKRMESD